MTVRRWLKASVATALAGAIGLTSTASAVELSIEFENFAPSDGFVLTPLWVSAHDGTFDLFSLGDPASNGLETIAETGSPADLTAELPAGAEEASGIAAPGGAAPVVESGEVATGIFDVTDPDNNLFFSFASMVIPSNDAFIGNGEPTAYRIFNPDGSFAGPLVIDIFGDEVYDAGTEVNDGLGAPFSTLGGTSTDEDSTVEIHPGLGTFIGTDTAAGNTLGTLPTQGVLFAQIRVDLAPTAVPEPGVLGLFAAGIALLGWQTRRQRA